MTKMDSNDMVNGRIYLIVDHLSKAFYIGRFDYFKLPKANAKGFIVIKDVVTILEHIYDGKMFFFDETKEIPNIRLSVKEITSPFGSGYFSVVQAIKYFMLTAEKSYDLFKVIDELRSEGKLPNPKKQHTNGSDLEEKTGDHHR